MNAASADGIDKARKTRRAPEVLSAQPTSDATNFRAPRRALPWLLALCGFALDVAAYWPGQMSFDSAYAWWQARGGASSDLVPPVLVYVWRLCHAILPGPGLPFALHLALFWSGLALFVRSLRLPSTATVATMALLAFAPVPWLLRGHVWTDVGLFSALCFASGALACARQAERRRSWLLLALPALLYAAALRHNALPAVLPFAAWWAWLAARSTPRRVVTALALLAAMFATIHLAASGVQRRVALWPSLAQFDLAAVSIATDRLLLPAFMVGPGLDVAELAGAFRPWSNTPMLSNTQHGMRDPFMLDFDADEARALRRAWLDAIVEHPTAWAAHRWRLTRALFGTHAAEWPHELVYVDEEVQYRDNPPVARNTSALHVMLMRAAAALVATPALAAWPYLLGGVVAGLLVWQRRRTPPGALALLLLASAALHALPLTLLAPSAELRYLGWPCVASLLAMVCTCAAPRTSSR